MYIIAGPNGSGKTTFAEEFIREKDLVFVNADIIAAEMDQDVTDISVMLGAGRIFFQQVNRLLKEGAPFVIETTLSGNYTIRTIDKLKKRGYKVKIVYVFVETPLLSIERIRIRVRGGGHHVPDDDVKRRYSRSIRNFWNTYKDLADSWEVYDNSGGRIRPVAIGKSSNYIILDNGIFETFKEVL